ncbi:MAG: heterodisulfide reductase-related iron-sulfur binding cluster [Promethearchaeota archaeon]
MNNIKPTIKFEDLKEWINQQSMYIFSGCVEENYPAIKKGIFTIGKFLGHFQHDYKKQSCCSGPLTKMGLGNQCTLAEYTRGNLDLREYGESIMLTSCNGCYSYMIKSKELTTDAAEAMKKAPLKRANKEKADNKDGNSSAGGKASQPGENFKGKGIEKPFLLHGAEYIATFFNDLFLYLKYKLDGFNFVLQYGCHYLNQYQVGQQPNSFRNIYAEHKKIKGWTYNSIPTYLHDILIPLGATITDYHEMILCCGGSTPQRQINLDNALSVAEKKFTSIHEANPDAIITICPLCMYFMEDSQNYSRLSSKFPNKIPIIHIAELIALLMGDEDIPELMKKSHKIPVDDVVDRIIKI